jgi:hypothetical protein
MWPLLTTPTVFVVVLGLFVGKGGNTDNFINLASFSHDGDPFGLKVLSISQSLYNVTNSRLQSLLF